MKIENNKVICDCGRELGDYKENEVYFCENCLKSCLWFEFTPETYGIKVSFEDIFGIEASKKH